MEGAPVDGFVSPTPFAPVPATPLATPPGQQHGLVLEARLTAESPPLDGGIIWRVFAARTDAEGRLPLITEAEGGTASVALPPGDYLVHAAFGRAGATKRVTIVGGGQTESLILDAGGLLVSAVVAEDEPIPEESVTFEVLQEVEAGDPVVVVPDATPGEVLRLSAGTYHVVSRYGDVNAIVRADIEVEAGKLIEAVMRHTGAEVTLKLVSEEGGEALANTSWAVITQDGNTVHESIGAFPSIVLAAGDYTAVATHQERIYSRDFAVQAGVDRDIEVRLSDLTQPEMAPGDVPEISGGPMQP
jgi:hypothetical protein